METCKIYSFDCTKRIDKDFIKEKRKFISDKLNQIDFQFGNYSEENIDNSIKTFQENLKPKYQVYHQIFNTNASSRIEFYKFNKRTSQFY